MMSEPTPRQQNRLQDVKSERNAAAFGEENSAEPLYGLAPIEGGADETVEESSAETPNSPDFLEARTRTEAAAGGSAGGGIGGKSQAALPAGGHGHGTGSFNLLTVILMSMAGLIITVGIVLYIAHGGHDQVQDILSRYPANR